MSYESSQPAFPNALASPTNDGFLSTAGLTKRELFAAMAMQSILRIDPLRSPLLGNPNGRESGEWLAGEACAFADALLAALAEPQA